MSDGKKDATVKENPKPVKCAGKGMSPIKGYNYKKYSDNYNLINWKKNGRPLKFTVKIDKNTTGEL